MRLGRIIYLFLMTAITAWQLRKADVPTRLVIKQSWAKIILKKLGYTLKVVGQPPGSDVHFLVGNHVSYLDIPVIMAALPEVTFLAKDNLLSWPVISTAARAAGTLFIRRGNDTNRLYARKQVLETLRQKDKKIVVFPSGRTTLHETKPWQRGIFAIAQETQCTGQLFRLDFHPLRDSAYVDDDNLIRQLIKILKTRHKTAQLTWLEKFEPIGNPRELAENLRRKVIVSV